MKYTIGLVYEITDNPFFGGNADDPEDRLTEHTKPTEVNRIAKSLATLGYEVKIIDGPHDLIARIEEFKDDMTLIFNMSRGVVGLEKKISVPAICQLYNIPFVGTSAYGLTLGRHKYHSNRLLHGLGFRVPRSVICYPGDKPPKDLSFPVIPKPNNESNSLGINENSVFTNPIGLTEAVSNLHITFRQPVVIEEYIGGDEFHVTVIGNKPNTQALGCVRSMREGLPIVGSVKTRKDNVRRRITYQPLERSALYQRALDIAIHIHDLFEFYDYSRCDFRIGRNDDIVCIEATPHPDLSEDSCFFHGALQTVSDYETMISLILESTMARYGISDSHLMGVPISTKPATKGGFRSAES